MWTWPRRQYQWKDWKVDDFLFAASSRLINGFVAPRQRLWISGCEIRIWCRWFQVPLQGISYSLSINHGLRKASFRVPDCMGTPDARFWIPGSPWGNSGFLLSSQVGFPSRNSALHTWPDSKFWISGSLSGDLRFLPSRFRPPKLDCGSQVLD